MTVGMVGARKPGNINGAVETLDVVAGVVVNGCVDDAVDIGAAVVTGCMPNGLMFGAVGVKLAFFDHGNVVIGAVDTAGLKILPVVAAILNGFAAVVVGGLTLKINVFEASEVHAKRIRDFIIIE